MYSTLKSNISRKTIWILIFSLIMISIIYTMFFYFDSKTKSVQQLPIESIRDENVSELDIKINTAGIKVNNSPLGLFVDKVENIVYTADRLSNSISVIDIEKGDTTTIFLDNSPFAIDKNLLTNMIYVTHPFSNSISIIDGTTNRVVSTIDNITTPINLKVDSRHGYLYLTNIDTDTITQIDLITQKRKSALVGDTPYDIDINQNKNNIYVTNTKNNNITVVNGKTLNVIKNIPVQVHPVGIKVDENNNIIYVTNFNSNTISIINENSNTT